jgi:dTDP-4-amino-4,6-dideoxygalactose transaminase
MLRVKLPSLSAQVAKRRALASRYLSELRGLRLPVVREGCEHAFHQFVIRSEHRDGLQAHLKQRGVPSAVLYPAALHQQPAFACAESFPVAEKAVRKVLSLPLHPYLSEAAIDAVCTAVEDFTA